MGVSIGPGLTAFSRILREISSPESVLTRESMAAFDALYTLEFGIPRCALIEPLTTMAAGFAKSGRSA